MKSRVCVVFLLLAGSVVAQLEAGTIIRRMRIHVSFENGVCDLTTRVELMGRSGPMSEAVTNDQCAVDFVNIPVGTYHVIVSGQNMPNTDAGSFDMDSTGANELEIKVKRAGEPQSSVVRGPANAFVSASDLAIPLRAQKEFAKASELMAKQNREQAIQRFNKAIAMYPDYAGAYNSLGVIYSQSGDIVRAREALLKAIHINGRFALAYMNLGLLNLSTGDFSSAESVLNKANSFDPTSEPTLEALTYAEFMDHHFDDAIATSQKAHALRDEHAFVHHVAARAYEQKSDAGSAIEELELFLKEQPTGEKADAARKELAKLQAIAR
jgi:tetratricopeptide (TPR) repeat protein